MVPGCVLMMHVCTTWIGELDLGVGGGLDGDSEGEEVVSVVYHPCTDPFMTQLARQPKPKSDPF